jgi:hypothetical protein
MIILNIRATDNIQDYLDIVEENGGGILNLAATTYTLSDDITVPNRTTINGNGATLDFNNTAKGVKIIGTALVNKTNCSLERLTIINSTTIGVECEYTENPQLRLFNEVLVNNCPVGISIINCIDPYITGTFSNNGVNCVMTNVTAFATDFTAFSNATTGDGLVMTGCSSGTIFNSSFESNTSDGLTMTNCSYITILSNSIFDNGADGLKLISGNTAIIVNGNDISDNTTNGINIATDTTVNTLISSNTFALNGTAVTNNGTTTLIRSNIGVVDN